MKRPADWFPLLLLYVLGFAAGFLASCGNGGSKDHKNHYGSSDSK